MRRVLEGAPEATVTASAGLVSVDPRREATIASALQRADIALYDAKESGRDRMVVARQGVCG